MKSFGEYLGEGMISPPEEVERAGDEIAQLFNAAIKLGDSRDSDTGIIVRKYFSPGIPDQDAEQRLIAAGFVDAAPGTTIADEVPLFKRGSVSLMIIPTTWMISGTDTPGLLLCFYQGSIPLSVLMTEAQKKLGIEIKE